MADEKESSPGIIQRMIDQRNEWAEQQPSITAELKAMAREGVKDIRSTVNETFLGSPEYGGEPGTPMNPTPQMVTQDMGNVYGNYNQMLDSYASRGAEQEPQKEAETQR